MPINKDIVCPNCLRDYESERDFVWSSIYNSNICMYCDLEIGLEFQEGFGDTYTQLAVRNSGLDYFEVKKRYVEQIVVRIQNQLAGNISQGEREHREWNLAECGKQLLAISSYQKALLEPSDLDALNLAKANLDRALSDTSFGIDLIRPYMNCISN